MWKGIDDTKTAVVAMMMATLCITVVNLSAQQLMQSLHWAQVLWLRGAVGFLLILCFCFITSHKPVMLDRRSGLVVLSRTLLELAMFAFFLTALRHVSLGFAASIAMLGPPILVCLAALLLKEALYRHRVVAVSLSFIAAILIVNPTEPNTDYFSLICLLASVLCFCANALLARKFGSCVTPMDMTIYSHGLMVMVLLPMAEREWQALDWARDVEALMILSMASLLGISLFSVAYRMGQSAYVSTFYYSEVLWALLFDYLVFQFVPPMLSVFGILLLIGAGVMSTVSELARVRKIDSHTTILF